MHHLNRVYSLARHIQKEEGGDELVVAIAAFVHDMHRLMQNETKEFVHPRDSLPKVREILEEVDFPAGKIEKVLHCVEFHEEYGFSEKGKTVNDLETLILQDADNLDALGAIGIGRTFSYGGAHGIPMYNPEISLDSKSAYDEDKGHDPSTIHHFSHKLLRLKDQMNTRTAKNIAESRHEYVKNFADRFLREWRGAI